MAVAIKQQVDLKCIACHVEVGLAGHHLRGLLGAKDRANVHDERLGLPCLGHLLLKLLSWPLPGANRSEGVPASESDDLPGSCAESHPELPEREYGSHPVLEPPATAGDWLALYADSLFDLHTGEPTSDCR